MFATGRLDLVRVVRPDRQSPHCNHERVEENENDDDDDIGNVQRNAVTTTLVVWLVLTTAISTIVDTKVNTVKSDFVIVIVIMIVNATLVCLFNAPVLGCGVSLNINASIQYLVLARMIGSDVNTTTSTGTTTCSCNKTSKCVSMWYPYIQTSIVVVRVASSVT